MFSIIQSSQTGDQSYDDASLYELIECSSLQLSFDKVSAAE